MCANFGALGQHVTIIAISHPTIITVSEHDFWVTVCKTVRPMLPYHCLSVCLSVTLVYCGQTGVWIKMPLGMEVGLGPGDTALDGDPAPPRKGAQQPPPLFGPCLLWPNDRPSQQLLSFCSSLSILAAQLSKTDGKLNPLTFVHRVLEKFNHHHNHHHQH